MDFNLPPEERSTLCDLELKQAGYAALPIMTQRKQMWYDLNDARRAVASVRAVRAVRCELSEPHCPGRDRPAVGIGTVSG